jgi:pyruvate formate lyase activating enzyme
MIVDFLKSSMIDYPGKIASVLFTAGCNFRCPYCHNAPLVTGEMETKDLDSLLDTLIKRKRFVDAIVISGGEPTLHADLLPFLKTLKSQGFSIKLDTNGTKPNRLNQWIRAGVLDYIAMDIKQAIPEYGAMVHMPVDLEAIEESVSIIRLSEIPHEFRTTVYQEGFQQDDFLSIAKWLRGSPRYAIQNFHPQEELVDSSVKMTPYPIETLQEIQKSLTPYFGEVILRK